MIATRRVEAFPLMALPRLPGASARWTRLLARTCAGFPPEVALAVAGLPSLWVRRTRLDFASDGDYRASSEVLGLEAHGRTGQLSIDSRLAVAATSALLTQIPTRSGTGPLLTTRRLGRAERGVLAAAVAGLLDALDLPGVRLLTDVSAIWPTDGLSVGFDVRLGSLSGTARLVVPAAWLERRPTRVPLVDPAQLAPLVVLELARTQLLVGELSQARAGDAVVFEGTSPARDDLSWPVLVRFGSAWCAVDFQVDGALRRAGSIQWGSDDPEEALSDPDAKTRSDRPALSAEVSRTIGGTPVEVVAEIGRMTVRADELAGLMEGGVLQLGKRTAAVELRVGDRPWAVGELVTVDDQLAVRIVEVFTPSRQGR